MYNNILDIITNKSKDIIDKPFKYIILDNFFDENIYTGLCEYFDNIKNKGLSEAWAPIKKLSKFNYYDAYMHLLSPKLEYPMKVFYSQEFKNHISDMFDIKLTNDVNVVIHHHKKMSENGWVHDDYNPVGFIDDPLENGINPFKCNCDHELGHGNDWTKEVIRSIAILYYFNNESWSEGDGGETGLYIKSKKSNDFELFKKVNPVNNRILIYETCPWSWHKFLQNKKNERNAIVMWFHSDVKYRSNMFPDYKLQYFHRDRDYEQK